MSTRNNNGITARRSLRFESLDDIAADVERLARAKHVRTLGNWSAGQIFQHLAIVMHGAIDGMEIPLPLPMRLLLPVVLLFRKQKFLNSPMPAGISLPKAAATALIPPPTSWDDGLAALRSGLRRLQASPRFARHPFLGNLTAAEWAQVQCRHCELHLSFLVPEK